MGFRFRRTIKIGGGIRLNVSKSGVSTSIGRKGFTKNFSKKGTRTTVSIPGSGLSYSTYRPRKRRTGDLPEGGDGLFMILLTWGLPAMIMLWIVWKVVTL